MKEWIGKATVENLPRVTDFINALLEGLACPAKARMQIDVAIDELFGNIAHYAYGDQTGDAAVQFDYDEEQRLVSITFVDQGVPFDPLEAASPDVTLPAEDRTAGGLGIFLVRRTMDEVAYRYENGRNMLTIRKKIERDKLPCSGNHLQRK